MKDCIVYVCNNNWLLYTMVSINSFIESNKWFVEEENDIVIVVTDTIDENEKAKFYKLYKNTKFKILTNENNKYLYLQQEFLKRLGRTESSHNNYNTLFNKFIVFDLYREYRKVLSIESDIIVNNSLEYIFKSNYSFAISCGYTFVRILNTLSIAQNIAYEYNKDIPISNFFKLSEKLHNLYYNEFSEEPKDFIFKLSFWAGLFFIDNTKMRNRINYDILLNFVQHSKIIDKFYGTPINTIEEMCLNLFLEDTNFFDYTLTILSPKCEGLFMNNASYNMDDYFTHNMFESWPKNGQQDQLWAEMKKYNTIHFMQKPWAPGIDITEIGYLFWYKLLYKTLLKINS